MLKTIFKVFVLITKLKIFLFKTCFYQKLKTICEFYSQVHWNRGPALSGSCREVPCLLQLCLGSCKVTVQERQRTAYSNKKVISICVDLTENPKCLHKMVHDVWLLSMQKFDCKDQQSNYMGKILFFKVRAMYKLMSQSHCRTFQCSKMNSLGIILYSLKDVDFFPYFHKCQNCPWHT